MRQIWITDASIEWGSSETFEIYISNGTVDCDEMDRDESLCTFSASNLTADHYKLVNH